jgi:predicted phage terminase large subunit-like protein
VIRKARRDASAFVEWTFTDPQGQPLQQGAIHRELQTFLSANRRALVELPRDHGKSTQVCARLVWELARDPSLRIKIVCASGALAAERGRFIRRAIESSERLRLVFPDLRRAHPWSDTRLTVERPANVIGPSLAAFGIGAASTGSRADLLVCDDIVDVKALASRADRDRVKQFFRDNLMNLLEPDGRFWGLCTPWHRDDLNAELKRNAAYPLFHRAITDDLQPIWRERWPREALEARRAEIGPVSFARGYRLLPLADDALSIPAEKIHFWDESVQPERLILSVDPAISTRAQADRSALVVLARCGNEIRCLDAIARRVSTPDLVELIDLVDQLWRPAVILFESNAAFRGIAQLMTRQAAFGPKVNEVQQTTNKEARVAAFSVPVANGSFRLKGDGRGGVDPGQQELFDEMTSFPVGAHDDLLDAAAMGTAYLLGVGEPRVW